MSDNSGLSAGYTKADIITSAFNEIGYADYLFDITPDQLFRVARQLEGMMGNWSAIDINVGWPFQIAPFEVDINQQSNLSAPAIQAVYLNLAVAIAPSFGKTLTQQAIVNAKRAYDALLVNLAFVPSKQFPNTLLAGAGNRNLGGAGLPSAFNNQNSTTKSTEIFGD